MGLLRLALAISVLLTHMGNFNHHSAKKLLGFSFVEADVAVQCFFVLSGFYMALVLNEKYRGPDSYRLFITQRFFRLYPTYWLIFGFILVGELLIAATHGNRPENAYTLQWWLRDYATMPWLTWIALGFSNLMFLGLNDLLQFTVSYPDGHLVLTGHFPSIPAGAYTIDPPAWSLGIEVVFYLFAPFLVRRAVSWQVGLLLLLATIRLGLQFGWHVPYSPYIYCSALLQFPFFLAGSLAYRIYRNIPAFPRLYAWSGVPWIVLLAVLILLYHRLPFAHSIWLLLYPVLFISIPALFTLTRNNFWDRQIGELSYPFYLIHFFVIELANVAVDQINIPDAAVTPLCLLVTLLLSIAITQLFENRVDRFRAALFQRSKKQALSAADPLAGRAS
jgi:peptidoglycan/LPS O-acetylase OafA/YrhL